MKEWEILRIRSLNTAEILFSKKILQKFSHFSQFQETRSIKPTHEMFPCSKSHYRERQTRQAIIIDSRISREWWQIIECAHCPRSRSKERDRWRVISWSPCKLIPIPPIIPNLSRSLSRHLSAHRSDVYPTRGVSIKSSKQGLSLPSSLI